MTKIRMTLALGTVLLAVEFVGCGSDGPTAPERCNDFVAKICKRLVACWVDNGTIAASAAADSEASCVETSAANIGEINGGNGGTTGGNGGATGGNGCDRAVAVGTTYSACMSKLDTVACSTLVAGTLPDECFGAITTR